MTRYVVDDDEAIRNALRVALDAEGYRVVTAGNGMERLDCWSENHVNVVLPDTVARTAT
jgi:DNA-binding response OmpR family regulator